MSGVTVDPRLAPRRTAPKKAIKLSWSDPRVRNIVWQALIIGAVVALVWYLTANTRHNLEARHIASGFGFLFQSASIPIGEHMIDFTPSVSTYGRALVIGFLNTLKVAVVGVVLATILGTLVGIGRLSPNWLLSKLTAVYVETLRDIPVAAATVLLVRPAADLAGAAPGVPPGARRVPVQSRPEAADDWTGRRRIGGCWRRSSRG